MDSVKLLLPPGGLSLKKKRRFAHNTVNSLSMCEHEKKYCPRCNNDFECKVGSILICQCTTVPLTQEERDYIAARFSDCLCAGCLGEMKAAFHKQIFEKRLYDISPLLFRQPDNG